MENLFRDFLGFKNLTKEYEEYVKLRQSEMQNICYDLDVMIGDADFFLNMVFILTKEDLKFLQEWLKTIEEDAYGFSSHEKDFSIDMLKRLFGVVENKSDYLEGPDYCSGTSFKTIPTAFSAGDNEDYFYESLETFIFEHYKEFSDDLKKLFYRTSFYIDFEDFEDFEED